MLFLYLFGSSSGAALVEAFYSAGSIHDFFSAAVKRMALAADFNIYFR